MRAKYLKFALGLLVSTVAVYLLLSGLNTESLAQSWSRLSLKGLLLALGLLVVGYTLRIVRWWWMLRTLDAQVRLRDCVTPFLGSIALNNVLPFRAGDVVRAFGFRRQLALPAGAVLGTVVVERLLDLAMLLSFFFVGAASATATLPHGFSRGAAVLAVAAAIGLVLLPLVGPRLAAWLAPPAQQLADSPLGAIRAGVAGLLQSFALLRSGFQAVLLLPLTVLIWTFEGAVFATVAWDLSADVPPIAAWFAMASGTLATLLPSTPGYIGTFDYFTMLGLTMFGATRELATAFSISVHALLWVPCTAVGLILLLLHGGSATFAAAINPRGSAPAR
jgi:uncharacterized membrane protein YbhN (UPF0104 family)